MHYETREAQLGDAESIARLIAVLGYGLEPAQVSERLGAYRNESSRVFVALLEATVVGFLSFHAIPLFHQPAMLGRITAMAIDPQHFRQGIGSSLLKAAEDFAVRVGCSRIEVTSGDHREGDAHLFYASQGYRSDCRRFQKQIRGTEQVETQQPSPAALSAESPGI
jgi:GNAT superfamily N-acetyltransferase